jgi:hypothetical protein
VTGLFGARHTPAPPEVPHLSTRAALHRMAVPLRADHFAACSADGDMLGNHLVGNCVPVADFRLIQTWLANVEGRAWQIPQALVMGRYALTGGYVPGEAATDRGTDTAEDMMSWCAAPIVTDDETVWPVYWAVVTPTDESDIAIALAEMPLLVTLMLPGAVGTDTAAWGRAPGTGPGWEPRDGHRVLVGGFEGRERICRTWGMDVVIHPEFWLRYVVAVDVPILTTSVADLTLAGLDFHGLEADMRALVA